MFAHWRFRGRVEGRWAAVGQSTAAVEAGRGERGRGRGGGREVHLCGAPSGLPLLRFCERKHLQMRCGGGRGGVTEIQYWQ